MQRNGESPGTKGSLESHDVSSIDLDPFDPFDPFDPCYQC
jgi:hypothetical protein